MTNIWIVSACKIIVKQKNCFFKLCSSLMNLNATEINSGISSNWFASDLRYVDTKVTLGSCHTKETDPDVFSPTFAKMYLATNQLRASRGKEAQGQSGCCRLFADGDLLARGTRDAAQGGEPLAPRRRRFRPRGRKKKRRVIRSHFCQQKKRAAQAGLPAGRCDSLHSNNGSAPFPCSTLGAAVQSQAAAEQRERGGHRQASLERKFPPPLPSFFSLIITA